MKDIEKLIRKAMEAAFSYGAQNKPISIDVYIMTIWDEIKALEKIKELDARKYFNAGFYYGETRDDIAENRCPDFKTFYQNETK